MDMEDRVRNLSLGTWGDIVAEGMDHWALNDGQKTRLLSLALEHDNPAAAPNEDEQKGDLLRDILRCALPLEAPVSAAAVRPFSSGPPTTAGPPLGELLRDRTTSLVALQRIKEYAKALGKNAKSGIERDVFLAVYFAAIAAARVYHNKCITEHADERLVLFLSCFAQTPWVPTDLAALLAQAARHRMPDAPSADRPQE